MTIENRTQVSFYTYIRDRICGLNQVPFLADIIDAQARDLELREHGDAASGRHSIPS